MRNEERISLRALAAGEGMRPSRAAEVLSRAGIESDDEGRFPKEQAKDALAATKRPAAVAGQAAGIRHAPIHVDVANELARSKRDYAAEQARALKLKNGKLAGLLVSRDEVEATFLQVSTDIRQALLGLPRKLAPLLVEMKDERAIRKLLDDEIKRTLHKLADKADEDPLT